MSMICFPPSVLISQELAEMNLKNQKLVVNGVFQAMNPTDEVKPGALSC